MLSARDDSGKYLTKKFHCDRQAADRNEDNFIPSELTFLDHDGVQDGPIGRMDYFDSTMRIGTSPVGYYDEVEDYDYRCKPEVR